MSKFKVGDKVKCIIEHDRLILNSIYEISYIDDYYLGVKGVYASRDDWSHDRFELVESIEKSDITKDLKKALDFLDLHDKDKFMMDNIISTLEDKINELSRS